VLVTERGSGIFGGDKDIVGKSVPLDDQAYSIVGVMPAGFGLPRDRTDVWCLPGFDLSGLAEAATICSRWEG